MKRLRLALTALALLPAALGALAAESIELDYRLRADRDLVSDEVDENVTTMRVADDRGLVARNAEGGGARFPLTYHTVTRRNMRFTTGSVQADGSFPATLSILSRDAVLRVASGEERPAPGQPQMDKLVLTAVIDAQGRVQRPQLQAEGGGVQGDETLMALMSAVLEQATQVGALRLEQGQSAEQVVSMKLPLPGLAPLDLSITASNRLIEVTDGQARIQLVYVMAFGLPEGPVRLEATGTGGGSMDYDVANRIVRRMETHSLMTVLAHVPDGTLAFEMSTRQTKRVREAPP